MAQVAMSTSATNLYHYTTQAGRDGILRDMLIRGSVNTDEGTGGGVPTPARYGPGVYLTSYRPRNPDDKILKGIYDSGDMAALDRWENLKYVVTIHKEVCNCNCF